MRENVLATIELAPGSVGWYDSLTGIHLSLTKKRFFITDDIDKNKLTNVRKAVEEGKLIIVSGSQNLMCDSVSIIDNPIVYQMPKETIVEQPALNKKEEIIDTIEEKFEDIEPSNELPEIEEVSIETDFNDNKKTKKKKNKK